LKPFETVMAKSRFDTIKEHLLNCVEQIILIFGSSEETKSKESESEEYEDIDFHSNKPDQRHGTLRSGWRPILTVLGLAGLDSSDEIANTGFKMLTSQLGQCLQQARPTTSIVQRRALKRSASTSSLLLVERFIDLVDALLMFVKGDREKMSITSIDHLLTLSNFLGDENVPLPLVRSRLSASTSKTTDGDSSKGKEELELWWPLLLGLSRSAGDSRLQVRTKSLMSLLSIVNKHFFPQTTEDGDHPELQTLQLIFRGILIPILEHAETDTFADGVTPPTVPTDFERFITQSNEGAIQGNQQSWLETTFEPMVEGCIEMCMRSIEIYKSDMLVEEILAIFNTCLQSDSGALAVLGLKRLFLFVTQDLAVGQVTDDTWATVSHMLSRSVAVRGLPVIKDSDSGLDPEEVKQAKLEEQASIAEFIAEDEMLKDRRFIGGQAVHVIGSLLTSETHANSIGLRWYVFLANGVGSAIVECEEAAALLASKKERGRSNPPDYLENALYGRKWMVKFLSNMLHDSTITQTMEAAASDEIPGQRFVRGGQTLLMEQTKSLLATFLEKEASARNASGKTESKESVLMSSMVSDLLSAYEKLPDARLLQLSWLTPLLSSCIQSNHKSIRDVVQGLINRMLQGSLKDKPNVEQIEETN